VYNLIDFGEDKTNEDGETYGLSAHFFPNQTTGSTDIEVGGIWHQTMTYSTYSPYNTEGGINFNSLTLLGGSNGSVSNVVIFTEKTPLKFNAEYENDPSYLFPARLVSVQGN
jgi:hypothetical protein